MIYFCSQCYSSLTLLPGVPMRCHCGAVYMMQLITSNTTSTALTLHATPAREAVPKAFYDAFSEKELQL